MNIDFNKAFEGIDLSKIVGVSNTISREAYHSQGYGVCVRLTDEIFLVFTVKFCPDRSSCVVNVDRFNVKTPEVALPIYGPVCISGERCAMWVRGMKKLVTDHVVAMRGVKDLLW